LAILVLLMSLSPASLLSGVPEGAVGVDGQFIGKQGQVLLVNVEVSDPRSEVVGKFMGRTIPFFPTKDEVGSFSGLVGVDMQDTPGSHELRIVMTGPGEVNRLSYKVLVLKEQFPVQHLKLPKEMVDLDAETLTRVKVEQEQVQSVMDEVTTNRLWSESFIAPVQGAVSKAFGRVRMINGQPRNPHNGEDIGAQTGTAVVAMNSGIVRLTVDHYFSGKGVFLDHGLGLHSMYFHLSDISVRNGESISRGQVIGKVGATGRATGPHLHWGVRINGARVNPYALISLPIVGKKTVAH
jgi:hypothetical protein